MMTQNTQHATTGCCTSQKTLSVTANVCVKQGEVRKLAEHNTSSIIVAGCNRGMWGNTCGGRTPSSCMDSICPSFRAAPRMRHRALASLSAFLSVRYALKPSCLAFAVGEKKLLTCNHRSVCVAHMVYGHTAIHFWTTTPLVQAHHCTRCAHCTSGVRGPELDSCVRTMVATQ